MLRRLVLIAALVVLSGGGLSACRGEPTAVAPESEQVPVQEAPTIAVQETAADTLVFGHPSDAVKLDPSDVTDGESLLVTWHIYDGLTRYVRGTTEIEPALATSWSVSDDGLEWTFNLREGVTFHDGTPFDAAAVVWNFDRWSNPDHEFHFDDWEFAYWADMFQGYKGDTADDGSPQSFLSEVQAVDSHTVMLKLHRPNAPLLQTLAMGNFGFSSPTAVMTSGSSYGTPDGDPIAAGTGPYMVDSWAAGDQITVIANPSYWGSPPATPRIIFRVIPENTARFLAVRNGEVDGMNQVNPEDIAAAQTDPNTQIVFEPANNVGYLGFNQAHEPWANVNCRQAVAHAIDKAGIVASLYAGDAEVATQMLPPSMWGHNPAIIDHAYDMEAAMAAMETCSAEETMPDEVVLYVPPIPRFYYPKPAELGEVVQSSLALIGVQARIESPEWGSWLTQVRGGEADLFLLGWGGDNGDPDNYLCVFFCGGDRAWNSAPDGSPMPPHAELNTLLREASTITDQQQRNQMYQEANVVIHENVLAVPLVHRTPPLVFRSNVAGYIPSPIQTILTTVSKQ